MNIQCPIDQKSPPRTLLDVLERIRDDEELPNGKRQQWCSAIKRLGELVGDALSDIPASVTPIRDLLNDLVVPPHVMKKASWANLRSHVKAALAHVTSSKRNQAWRDMPLTPEWEQLREGLSQFKGRLQLAGFMRFCSVEGIEPTDVSEKSFTAYRAFLDATRIHGKPEHQVGMSITAWNRAAGSIDGWPDRQIDKPDRRNRFAIPRDRFPISFQEAVAAELDRLQRPNPLDDLAPPKALRPATLRSYEHQIWRLASAIVLSGTPIEALQRLTDLVDLERFKEALRWLLQERAGWRSGDDVPGALIELASSIRSHARYWFLTEAQQKGVAADENEIASHMAALKKITQRLGSRPKQMTEKNRKTLRQFGDPQLELALLLAPETMIEEAEKSTQPLKKRALTVQSAIAIQLLQLVPLRFGNLRVLRFEEHIQWIGMDKHRRLVLVLPSGETKNAVPTEMRLPEKLENWLELYRTKYLPALAREGTDFLFPGQNAVLPKHAVTLRGQLTKALQHYVGVTMTPHQFRHLSAMNILKAEPGNYGLVQQVLGHKHLSTSIDYYAAYNQGAAMEHFGEIMDQAERRAISSGRRSK